MDDFNGLCLICNKKAILKWRRVGDLFESVTNFKCKNCSRSGDDWVNCPKFKITTCVNIGCYLMSAIRHTAINSDGYLTFSLKPECGSCYKSRILGKPKPGVTYIRQNHCSNFDGKLGYYCPHKMWVERLSGLPDYIINKAKNDLHLDHIDGNKYNNHISNIQTLCESCHKIKSYQENNFNKYQAQQKQFASF